MLTARQKRILNEVKNRKPTLFQKASKGDKVARHMLTCMGFDCDYDPKDMDGPKGYQLE